MSNGLGPLVPCCAAVVACRAAAAQRSSEAAPPNAKSFMWEGHAFRLFRIHNCMQVDSFSRAMNRSSTAGKLTSLFKSKLLSRTTVERSGSERASPSASGAQAAQQLSMAQLASAASPLGAWQGQPLSPDEMLTWSNVRHGLQ